MNTLDNKQKQIYERIIRERLLLYIGGMLLGILAVGIFSYNYTDSDNLDYNIYVV